MGNKRTMIQAKKLAEAVAGDTLKYVWHWCLDCNAIGVPSTMHHRYCKHRNRSLGETSPRLFDAKLNKERP